LCATPYLDIATLQRRKTPSILPGGNRPKIGIVWAGSPTYQNDRHRSIALPELLPILRLPDFDFYSLQKGERCRELLGLPPDCRVRDLELSLADFGDTALVIDALDLVITVDTAVAHLAGALDKPVWTLLPEVPDWRWGLTDPTTPWYRSMRLFRQDRRGDWAGVMGRVSEALLKDSRVMTAGDR